MAEKKKINMAYIPSESMHVQGTYADFAKRYGKRWRIRALGKGNGNWMLTRPSNVLVENMYCRNWILNHYRRT